MSNLDLNKFNSFLEKATQAISCNSDCQKEKVKEQLKDKYLSAKKNLILANPEYQLAKKNYYTYVSGKNVYNEMIENELTQTADLIVQTFKEKYADEISKIKSQLDTYNGILINLRNVVDLHKKYKRENLYFYKQLKENTNDILTNERKTYYEDQGISSLNAYYYYILWLVYIIVILCLIIFTVIYPTQTSLYKKILLIIVFVILPFISTWLLSKIIYIINLVFNFFPKNVYK